MVATIGKSQISERLPPHAIEAEMVTLSSLMMSMDPQTAAFAETIAIVGGRDAFYSEDNALIFDAIVSCANRGRVDGELVYEEMKKRETLGVIGGPGYLGEVLSSAPNAAHGPHYASIVRERYQRRQLLSLGADIQTRCLLPSTADEPASIIGESAATRLAKIVSSGAAIDSETLETVSLRVLDEMDKGEVGSVMTGFTEFDELTGGIFFGEEVILAARPSMGKSAIAKQIAYQVAKSGTPVALISQEESKAKIVRNLIALIAQIDNNRLRKPGALSPVDWAKIHAAQGEFAGVPLYINDRARTLRDVRAAAAALVARHGCRLIVIDYLQRIGAPGGSRYEQVTEISKGVSDIVKDLNVAGLVLAQLSRESAKRDDKRPTMTDLRESGQIEQDADGVVFLHREDYYHLDDDNYRPDGIAELIVSKWRDGVRGKTVRLKSDLKHQGFLNLKSNKSVSGMSDAELGRYGL
jgi:replicative DNA helicase